MGISWKEKVMICCVGILSCAMLIIFIRLGTTHIAIKRLHMDNIITKTILFDNNSLREIKKEKKDINIKWDTEYPFETEEKLSNYQKPITLVHNMENKIKSDIENKIDEWTNRLFVKYFSFVEMGRTYENIINWGIINPSMNVAYLNDGYLTFVYKKEDMTEQINALKNLSEFTCRNGAKFLFIQAPIKINKYDDIDINNKFDYSNENADEIIQALKTYAINTFDLRDQLIQEKGKDNFHSLFFRTDHHWKPETGLIAAKIIATKLHKDYDIDVDFSHFDINDYQLDKYSDWFLGSQGKKVTLAKTRPDDIELIHPCFKNKIHLYIPSKNIDEEGDFNIIYDMQAIEKKDLYNSNPYAAYSYSDQAVMNIENLELNSFRDQKILVIKDSFGNSMVPFLAMGCRNIMTLDVRFFTGSVKTYITTVKPDIVIVMYTPSYEKKIDWSSHTDRFDFR